MFSFSGGIHVPVCRDFVVNLSDKGPDYVWIGLQSKAESSIPGSLAFLNGLKNPEFIRC